VHNFTYSAMNLVDFVSCWIEEPAAK